MRILAAIASLVWLLTGAASASAQVYLKGEYLLWWTKDSPAPTPLVATGSLGAPGTRVVLGREDVDTGEHHGARIGLGYWLTPDHRCPRPDGAWISSAEAVGFASARPTASRPAARPSTAATSSTRTTSSPHRTAAGLPEEPPLAGRARRDRGRRAVLCADTGAMGTGEDGCGSHARGKRAPRVLRCWSRPRSTP